MLISYYGSKCRLAPKYPYPMYDTIIEPFAGGAGYSLFHRHKNVVLYEKDWKTYSVINYIIQSDPQEILNLPLIEPFQPIKDLDCCQEAKWLIGYWVNAAASRPRQTLSKWGRESHGKGGKDFWSETRRRKIAQLSAEIKHWKIHNDSYENCDNVDATWFIDPPYQNAGVYYSESSKNIDFNHLSQFCQSRNGQVIVCENDGADWLPFQHFRKMVGTKKKPSTEVVWYKNPVENVSNQFFTFE